MKRLKVFLIVLTMVFGLSLLAACTESGKGNNPEETKYIITFETNGGSVIEDLEFTLEGTLTLPENPTKEGCDFEGWYVDATFSTIFSDSYVLSGNLTLYAKWAEKGTVVSYTVSFNTDGGSTVAAQMIEKGQPATCPANPTKDGYHFIGWYKESACTNVFDFTAAIEENTTIYAKWVENEAVTTFVVSFDTNGGSEVASQVVVQNMTATCPLENPTKSGFLFAGWYEDSSCGGNPFDFDSAILEDTVLYAKWVELNEEITYSQAGFESAAFEWNDSTIATAEVYYKSTDETSYTKVDQQLLRMVGTSTARVDILGLKAEAYDFKIVSSQGTELSIPGVIINEYDRSGYAHFNYTSGVGAYNDDGSLKDDAIVIYVTDQNKDIVVVPGFESAGTGIGWILNNNQYSKSESNTYTPDHETKGIYALTRNHSVVVRFIGTVTAPAGLTAFNSLDNGGSLGDNGFMARMKNAKNLTLEGVGNDAVIKGWGFHFICNDSSKGGYSFETRNLSFVDYPEDALGMEGVQGVLTAGGSITGSASASSDLLAAVERCWVHHNSFYPGYCANPAESDKKEGDGSCDFKRGQYYTLSYNYFVDCHKTNLIGSSDNSLQYNVSMHHNWWNNCGSRMPLLRRANIHFYNNYISGDISTGASLSYVTSARANSYMFSEANYFDGCKNAVELASGGAVKSYNNTSYACFGNNGSIVTSTREESISNNCEFGYRNIDYRNFDTDPTLFYYDATAKKSDCKLTDATQARIDSMRYAGVAKRDYNIDITMNKTAPKNYVSFDGESLTVDLASVGKGNSVVSNVEFVGITGVSSGTVKFKGQGITFRLLADTEVVVTCTTAGEYAAELVNSIGHVYASKFGNLTITLPAGTYFIASGSKDKETSISSLVFNDTGSASEARLELAKTAIAAIPDTITYTTECYQLIKAAEAAYNALTATEKLQISNVNKITSALATYASLQVTAVEAFITAIGTVTENSGAAILAARTAYDALENAQKELVSNYNLLTAAELAYDALAVTAIITKIEALPSFDVVITDQSEIETVMAGYNEVLKEYNALSSDKKQEIANASKLIDGVEHLKELHLPYELKSLIEALPATVTAEDFAEVAAAKMIYEKLTVLQKSVLTHTEVAKLEAAIAVYDEYLSSSVIIELEEVEKDASLLPAGFSIVSGNYGKAGYSYNGKTYARGLKIESATKINFTTTSAKTLTLVIGAGKRIYIDGTSVTSDGSGIVTVELTAGAHTISKNDSTVLAYLSLV